jgi:signal recognition particle receptor subunit beta
VSTVNPLSRELSAKIVYYGPGLSGKTTSLQHVHGSVRPETRGQLVSLSTEGDRTLFFDFLPVRVEQVRGLTLRLQLYTVPGQVFYDATRKLVLNGADGVVFVADSQAAAMDSNLESMSNLETNLGELGIDLAAFPLVLQWNKRDLPTALPVERLRAALDPRGGAPGFETVARTGKGVLEALTEITRRVVKELKARQPQRRAPSSFGAAGEGLASRISAAAAAAAPALTPAPAPLPGPGAPPEDRAVLAGLSFARMFPERSPLLAEVELAIRERTYGVAVRAAAGALAEVLAALPTDERSGSARATLLGLDGQEYLRLGRLAQKADAGLTEADAYYALYVLVAGLVKAARI